MVPYLRVLSVLVDGSFEFYGLIGLIGEGIESMQTLAMIAILIGGMVAVIKHNGGIDYMLHAITNRIRTKKGAEFGIAGLVSVADIATSNNTISIVMRDPCP